MNEVVMIAYPTVGICNNEVILNFMGEDHEKLFGISLSRKRNLELQNLLYAAGNQLCDNTEEYDTEEEEWGEDA